MRQGEEMKKNRIVVNGFAFTDRETAQKAVKEAESIKYIKEKLDMENPRMVLEMYRKLTKEQVFRTPVGLVFLKQLQDCLARKPEFKMENLEPIRAVSLPKPQPGSPAGAVPPREPAIWAGASRALRMNLAPRSWQSGMKGRLRKKSRKGGPQS